jgi:two-component system response regulator AtoC
MVIYMTTVSYIALRNVARQRPTQTDGDFLVAPSVRFIGNSQPLAALRNDIVVAARSDAKVLITGETGAGKDVVARLIHAGSGRRLAPFATLNCAGVPDSLLESEMFGHVRGSFTGAYRDKPGLLEAASHGTIFLDEVGEMSARMQGALLRFLETGELQRVGADRAHTRTDVRVIAATNRDLQSQIDAGAFRQDLYYRLNVVRLEVPALRDHPEDVPELLHHFLDVYSREHKVARREISPEALELLVSYHWPGNVRELRNLVERMVLKAPGAVVGVGDLSFELGSISPETATTDGEGALPQSGPAVAAALVTRMLEAGESFWTVVYEPFMKRDLTRAQLRSVVAAGLERTSGNYRVVVQLFNMGPTDYKRFLGFLRKHNCHIPFQPFRVVSDQRVATRRILPETSDELARAVGL